MSWKPITRSRGGATRQGIWCSLSEKDVRITFGTDVIEILKIKERARLQVSVGEDDHIGRIRLCAAPDGLTVRKPAKSASLSVSFRKWEGLMEDRCAPVSMPFKVVGDGVVEATLPYWGQPAKLRARRVV